MAMVTDRSLGSVTARFFRLFGRSFDEGLGRELPYEADSQASGLEECPWQVVSVELWSSATQQTETLENYSQHQMIES